MAIDDLEVWCQELVTDELTQNTQRRTIFDNEYLEGWLRQQTVSTQQLNQLFYLLTSYSPPNIFTVHYVDSSTPVTIAEIACDGGSFLEADAPLLYEQYGGTMPDFTGDAPTGTRPVMRKQ